MKKFEVTFVYEDVDEFEPEGYVNEVYAENAQEAMKKTEQTFCPIIVLYVEEVK